MSVTERKGSIGILKGSGENEVFIPRANFSLKIVAKVEGKKDGYIARVTRSPDIVTRYVYYHKDTACACHCCFVAILFVIIIQ